MNTRDEVETIYCEHDQSVWEAAMLHGYTLPRYRVGASADSRPVDGEVRVAEVRAMRHSLPIPIFRKEVEDGRG